MDSLSIVKIGGKIIDDDAALQQALELFAKMDGYKILVHGGGRTATDHARSLGISSRSIDGRRITDGDMLKVVTMIYGGLINKNIVASLQSYECDAVGISGADADIIVSRRRPIEKIDYGFVGDIESVNVARLSTLIGSDLCPVICPLTHDGSGQLLNTNADTMAAEVAVAMATQYDVGLLYCYEHDGVLSDIDDPASVILEIDAEKYNTLRKQGIISAGMLPKMQNCLMASQGGVRDVSIGSIDMMTKGYSIKTTVSA